MLQKVAGVDIKRQADKGHDSQPGQRMHREGLLLLHQGQRKHAGCHKIEREGGEDVPVQQHEHLPLRLPLD